MQVEIPEGSLVVLVGHSGSGKSEFARRHFGAGEVVSADLQGSELEAQVSVRLEQGLLTVLDGRHLLPETRRSWVILAKKHYSHSVVLALDLPLELCLSRSAQPPSTALERESLESLNSRYRWALKRLKHEGFKRLYRFDSTEQVESAQLVRTRLDCDRREEPGPFDIVGDIHGCYVELRELLERLGYRLGGSEREPQVESPPGRRLIFLGDLVDRGPNSPAVLRLVMTLVEHGQAFCLMGNHEVKFLKKLQGRKVRVAHGLQRTLDQLEPEPAEFKERVRLFVENLPIHLVLDEGRLVVAHAGLKARYHGREAKRVESFALYGDTTGGSDEYGMPVRLNWAADYRATATVAYGHTPVKEASWQNGTVCLDTGCVFGGQLSALRYPERELVQVPAHEIYFEPGRPLA